VESAITLKATGSDVIPLILSTSPSNPSGFPTITTLKTLEFADGPSVN
jgi:hypothetical protein